MHPSRDRVSARYFYLIAALVVGASAVTVARATETAVVDNHERDGMRWVQVAAGDKFERTKVLDAGMSIENIVTDSVWGFADAEAMTQLREKGMRVLSVQPFAVGRGGHGDGFFTQDFPTADGRYHNYAETVAELQQLVAANPAISRLHSIGKSVEGRDIYALHINTSPESLQTALSQKPGAIYMGNHHAREHLSNEIPLMFAQWILANQADPTVAPLLAARDLWIIPMVNPDGVEHDIKTGRYQMWRKNRRDNGRGTFGVDLNRNYGFKWGTGGSSTSPSSDVYMGTAPFSEPESQTIRNFVSSQKNTRVLLSFHTFSELILYPWGHSNDSIGNARDLQVFETMAKTMATWNKYKPQQASDLYIASGDTTDWAYGEKGIFAFTFELTPKQTLGGAGFYPGAKVIDKTFADNLKPIMYMFHHAGDPYGAVGGARRSGILGMLDAVTGTKAAPGFMPYSF